MNDSYTIINEVEPPPIKKARMDDVNAGIENIDGENSIRKNINTENADNQNLFDARIANPTSFKKACMIINELNIEHFRFTFVKNKDFEGISIKQMNKTKTGIVSIKFPCEIRTRNEEFEHVMFLEAKIWINTMGLIKSHGALLRIVKPLTKTDGLIVTNEEIGNRRKWEVQEKEVDDDDFTILPMEYEKTYTLSLNRLKEFIKSAMVMKASEVILRVLKSPMAEHEETLVMVHNIFGFSSLHETSFTCKMDQSDNTMKETIPLFGPKEEIRDYSSADYWKDYQEIYKETFAPRMINPFLKNVEGENITISVPIQSPKSPLLLEMLTGIKKGHCRYYITGFVDPDEMEE